MTTSDTRDIGKLLRDVYKKLTASVQILRVGVFDSSGTQIDSFGGGGVASSVAINDGTITTQKLAVDASGKIGINALPAITGTVTVTGVATETTLSALNTKVTACNTGAIAGTVTANAGTNLNTSALALESGGNLATLAGKDFATETTLSALNTKVTACNTGAVVISSGTITGITNSVTVTATNLDIRDLAYASDSVTSYQGSTWNIGTVTTLTGITNSVAVTGTFWQATQPVSGTFWQATQPISGTVTANLGTIADVATQTTLSALNTKVTACNTGAVVISSGTITSITNTVGVTGTFWQATQPVSGTFWQATQPISGTVTADTELPAAAALADGASATPSTPTVGAVHLMMNATTVDRARSIINATNSTGTGIQAVGLVAQLDDTSPTAITENQFGNLRMSSRRGLYVEGTPSAVATAPLPVRETDGTSFLDPATLFDLDTGAGTQYVAGISLRRGASGGSVEAGTTTYPLAIERVDSSKTTYSATAVNIAPASSATDVFTITGTASKTVRVLRIGISGVQTTAGVVNVVLAKRSTADTSGTSAAVTAVPHDSGNAAATATVLSYTANPTTGTLVGNVRAGQMLIPAPASVAPNIMTIYDFGNLTGQCIVLRGTAQVLAVNLNAVTVTGGSMTYWCEWTEE